ncbi:hypothetical protein [Roseiflexus sp.]|uniref:hypothetical protein n=1 Tax=Roseiflexus sp. TaxID=2562120 RepID=UPI00398B6DCB
MQTFQQGIGQWLGSAEVFDGTGRFLGNGADMRHVRQLDDGQIRIDVAFVGPFKHAGAYFITDHGDYRQYHGPANVGFAETIDTNLVDANAYWPVLGLSQRFVLFILPDGHTQLSLALMSRGEQLLYTVVGQNNRVTEPQTSLPLLVSGASYDLAADPSAGRGVLLLHRAGVWQGTLTVRDHTRQLLGTVAVSEQIVPTQDGLRMEWRGGSFVTGAIASELRSNGYLAWSIPDQALAGSYSLSGGRARSGYWHVLDSGLRCWLREVVAHDGTIKALLRYWYRGGERIGIEYGFLSFTPQT